MIKKNEVRKAVEKTIDALPDCEVKEVLKKYIDDLTEMYYEEIKKMMEKEKLVI